MFGKQKSDINVKTDGIRTLGVDAKASKNKIGLTVSITTNDLDYDEDTNGDVKNMRDANRSKRKRIYDTDSELNRLLNEDGIQSAISKIGSNNLVLLLINNIPLFILAGGSLALIFAQEFGNNYNSTPYFAIVLVSLVVSFVVRKIIKHLNFKRKELEYNSKMYKIMHNVRDNYNWDYLICLIKDRIEKVKNDNIIFKRIIAIVLSLAGIRIITVNSYIFKYFNNQLVKNSMFKLVFLKLLLIVVLIGIVSFVVGLYDYLANDRGNLKKWHSLLNQVTRVSMDVELKNTDKSSGN